jgi:hypothetical protein
MKRETAVARVMVRAEGRERRGEAGGASYGEGGEWRERCE